MRAGDCPHIQPFVEWTLNMGEIADQIVDQMMFGGGCHTLRKRGFQSGSGNFMWRTSSGLVAMKSMTDEHLRNAIRLCEKNGNTGKLRQLQQILDGRESLIK